MNIRSPLDRPDPRPSPRSYRKHRKRRTTPSRYADRKHFKAMRVVADGREEPESDWGTKTKDPEYLKKYRHGRREARLPKDRRCPLCGKEKKNSRQWVILTLEQKRLINNPRIRWAICKSCHRKSEAYGRGPLTAWRDEKALRKLAAASIAKQGG